MQLLHSLKEFPKRIANFGLQALPVINVMWDPLPLPLTATEPSRTVLPSVCSIYVAALNDNHVLILVPKLPFAIAILLFICATENFGSFADCIPSVSDECALVLGVGRMDRWMDGWMDGPVPNLCSKFIHINVTSQSCFYVVFGFEQCLGLGMHSKNIYVSLRCHASSCEANS